MTDTATRPAEPRPPVDPRIRARRIEVRRDEGRRRRNRLLGVVAALAVIAALAGLWRSPAFDVDHIVVDGAIHTSSSSLIGVSGIGRRQAMTDVDGHAATVAISRLPWIAHVAVRRSWPGTVRITVVERVAIAEVRHGLGWAAVDVDGRVLAIGPSRRPGLPAIAGVRAGAVGSSVGATGQQLALARALPVSVAPTVDTIALRSGELWLTLRSEGIQVRFGPPTQLGPKIDSLLALLASADPTPRIHTIDVLVPTAPVLTREHQVTTDPALTKDQGGA